MANFKGVEVAARDVTRGNDGGGMVGFWAGAISNSRDVSAPRSTFCELPRP